MLQKGSQMLLLWALGLVWLTCGFTTVCESAMGANAASKNDCYRKTCMEIKYDIREAVCCENRLDSGAGLSCCGQQSFNPAVATCCKVEHGKATTALTQGLSETVSACCELKAYDSLNEICCQSTILAKPAPKAQCCGKEAFDEDKQMCCGRNRTILTRNSTHHQCCGDDQYDMKTQCCCEKNETLTVQPKDSSCCAEALGASEAFDEDKHMYCGRNRTILTRNSTHHQCCGDDQYDMKTQCCCEKNETLTVQPKDSSCCAEALGVKNKNKNRPQLNCTSLCGSSCYNPNMSRCCERNQTKARWCCTPGMTGKCDAVPTVYDPKKQVCCDGCVSEKRPWIDQCCGETPYGLAQRGVLCCNNTLYKDREDGEECSESNIPYNPAKGTICCSQFHGSPGQHCCGAEVYWPQTEICCNGHRNPKVENMHCCGVKAYNIKDPQMKCCAGTLYNLTQLGRVGHDARCCGSILQNPLDVCCSREDKEVLYTNKTGFRCCGHLYYNTSLWSCCADKLSPVHQPGQHQSQTSNESRLLSVNNLNETDLCEEMLIGTVESVSLNSTVLSSVLKICGRNGTVKPLPSPHILETLNRCDSPKLIPGKTYFFDRVNVFIDFNHDSILQSLSFIISKCYHF
ncbi:uncharacterized protein si:ch211-195m9.3 isoform X4 [Siniperca chuatsi]|uniref:uncharacterized protein si:ch211-195m9.3 isoform X4 n=1 Tax=Siniperca chuatsi TaxID=119488 RepID=UPI001CE1C5A2|nr:uncharacterized protein si:ch211-195m9.3 isoform X4 [Siniperca chuatsi]